MTKPRFEYGDDMMPKPIVKPKDNPIRPAHYHRKDGSIDVIEYMRANYPKEELRGFLRGNILKYTSRYDLKNGIEDLRKAEHFIEKLKELEES